MYRNAGESAYGWLPYNSAFAEHISKFLDYRENSWIKYMYPDYVHLKNLDNFFIQEGITNTMLTRSSNNSILMKNVKGGHSN